MLVLALRDSLGDIFDTDDSRVGRDYNEACCRISRSEFRGSVVGQTENVFAVFRDWDRSDRLGSCFAGVG